MTGEAESVTNALVVVPTFQEATNIDSLVRGIRLAAPDVHILVVDDDSPDGTADIAEALGHEVGNVQVLRRKLKEGLGPAYRAGFAWGLERSYDILAGMDADLSHDPVALPVLLGAIADGADFVIGSRYVPGGSIPEWPLHRRALSRCGNRYATTVLRLGVSDATSGYRAYRSEALRGIDLGQIRADGYGFLIEIVYRLIRQGRKVAEVPIAFVDRQAGDSKMSPRIIAEAFGLVTIWATRDFLHRIVPRRAR